MLSFLAVNLLFGAALADQPVSLNNYNHFLKYPLSSIQTGGRLTERQIAYLAQDGYKSLFSVVEFATNDTSFNGVEGLFPSTEYEMTIAQSYGLTSKYYVSSLTADSAYAISDIIKTLPAPVFIHCHVGWTATLFTEMHLYITGQIPGDAIIPNGWNYGFDYQSNADAVAMINTVTGQQYTAQGEVFEQTLAQGEYSYKYYFWTHRDGNDYWYNAGQVLDTHPDAIKTAGYASVISFRMDGEPTTRLPSDPATGPVLNNEFSDANGNYNATAEREAFTARGIAFYHLPISGSNADDWTARKYHDYKPTLEAAEKNGPVLAHCKSGHRSSAYTFAYLGQKGGHCTEWAVQQAKYVGFFFDAPGNEQTIQFFKEVLRC